MSRTCTRCHVPQPLTEYHKNSRRPSGLNWICRTCVNTKRAHANLRRAEDRLQQRPVYRSYEQVAAIMGIDKKTVWRVEQKALAKIKAALEAA